MASEFQGQFQEAMREAEMADVRKELDDLTTSATDIANIDPIGDANKELERTLNEHPAETASEPAVGETAATEPTPLPAAPSPVEETALAEPEKKQAGAT